MYKIYFSVIIIIGITIGLSDPLVPGMLLKWTPLLFSGFIDNIVISISSMFIGAFIGGVVGSFQRSTNTTARFAAGISTQFFRNIPWLVMLFLCVYLIPHDMLSDYLKTIIAFSLIMAAYVSEITRGVLESIPTSQWDAGYSLGLKKYQILLLIILPQGIKRALPPLMNVYTVLVTSTVLASIVGVHEVLSIASDITAADDNPVFFLPLYLYVMLWFFMFCYPISYYSKYLESKLLKNTTS